MEDCLQPPKKLVWYRQCLLEKPTLQGTRRQIAFIPEKFAKVGAILRIRYDDGWEDGWKVLHYGARQSQDENVQQRVAWRRTRKHSDLPRGTIHAAAQS